MKYGDFSCWLDWIIQCPPVCKHTLCLIQWSEGMCYFQHLVSVVCGLCCFGRSLEKRNLLINIPSVKTSVSLHSYWCIFNVICWLFHEWRRLESSSWQFHLNWTSHWRDRGKLIVPNSRDMNVLTVTHPLAEGFSSLITELQPKQSGPESD